MQKARLDETSRVADWTLYELRRTAATGMARLGVAPHVVERIVNHTTGTMGSVAGVYNRFGYLPEMRAALELWADYVVSFTHNRHLGRCLSFIAATFIGSRPRRTCPKMLLRRSRSNGIRSGDQMQMVTLHKPWRSLFVAMCLVALLGVGSTVGRAEVAVAVDFFYDDLAPHGTWVEHAHYGTVWYPHDRTDDWQPYVYGRWVWTADYGWYWESDEEWSWATYHYGRWAYTDDYGWVWVAGDEWGPAWVEWCASGPYVGWAPLPPEVRWRNGTFIYAGTDLRAPRYRSHWVFVTEARFASHHPYRYRAPRSRNSVLLQASVRATDYAVVNARVVNRSIGIARISAAAGVRIAPRAVVQTRTRVRARGGVATKGALHVYRPHIRARGRVKTRSQVKVAPPAIDLDSHVESDTRIRGGTYDRRRDHDPAVGGSIGGGIGVGGGAGIGGGGIGVGGGGGIRIGR